MTSIRPILLAAFLALLAFGTVAQASGSTTMALEMASAEGSAMSMGDCQGCPDEGNGKAGCDLVCTAPAFAVLKAADVSPVMPQLLRPDRPFGMSLPRGRRTPPDPLPPRPLI